MRRAAAFTVLIAVACTSAGCSTVELFRRHPSPPSSAPAANGPTPAAQLFGTPFPVPFLNGEATVTLENLRLIPSYVYKGAVLVLDTRSVQSGGQPTVDPAQFHAFDPAGREFERIAYPKGTVSDPLVRTVLQHPGQEVRGMIAWTMPHGSRVGRIDLSTTTSINSLTVARQPADPGNSAASTASTRAN